MRLRVTLAVWLPIFETKAVYIEMTVVVGSKYNSDALSDDCVEMGTELIV